MSDFSAFGFRPRRLVRPEEGGTEHVLIQRPLQRIMAFRGRTIDDIVNDRIVKNEIYGYWKLNKQINRSAEVGDLEQQWAQPAKLRRG